MWVGDEVVVELVGGVRGIVRAIRRGTWVQLVLLM